MRNNSSKLINVSLLFMFSLNIVLLLKIFGMKGKETNDRSFFDNSTIANYISSYLDLLENNGLQLNTGFINVHNNTVISGKELFDDNENKSLYLVCRVHEYDCPECTDYALAKFYEWDSLIVNTRLKRIIIGDYDNFSAMNILQNNQDIDCYYVDNLDIPMEERGFPFYFVMDSTMKIFDVFAPNSNFHKLTDLYISVIKEKWIKSSNSEF